MPDTPRLNRLAGSTSPYLLQHAGNPVDWYPWCPEALERARREERPIFLSIGYAACHWCHVMERESFEDPGIAALLNEHFVCIKVDREERPDLDDIYMSAVQLLTGSGGWPLTVFLLPDLRPFHGGTYFPPDDRYGRPGMRRLVPTVARLHRERRGDLEATAAELTAAVREMVGGAADPGGAARLPGLELVDREVGRLLDAHDDVWGGFGGAPKFPPAMGLSLLLRHHQRTGEVRVFRAIRKTLERMALGGIYDQVGGGFARYSTDERWKVPHFEKMLTDNALLVSVYAEALTALGDDTGLYRRIILDTLAFVERELCDPEGGFHSSLDADSEGEEGRFYTWTPAEVEAALGPAEAALFCHLHDVTETGNWEGGRSVAWLRDPPPDLAAMRVKLLAARAARPRPGLDDKVLTAWNGLMISAFARAAGALGEVGLVGPARRAAAFVLARLQREERLLRSWRRGQAGLAAYLEDYAFLANGLVDLYEATFETRWLREASRLAAAALELFADPAGGFFFTAADHEEIPVRPRVAHDGALPAGASVMAMLLLRLAALLDCPEWRRRAERAVGAMSVELERIPGAHHQMLAAVDWLSEPPVELVVVGAPEAAGTRALLAVARRHYLPRAVVAAGAPDDEESAALVPLLRGKTLVDGRPAAYVCRGGTCRRPVTTPEELEEEIRPAGPVGGA